MPKLNMTRFKQEPSCCAIAAVAMIGHYYDERLNYDVVKKMAEEMVGDEITDGLYTGEICQLLNLCGFHSVHVVLSDLNIVDYTWNKKSKSYIIDQLKKLERRSLDCREQAKSLARFLGSDHDNKMTVDHRFWNYIKPLIDQKSPMLFSFNWTMLFQFSKINDGNADAIKGDYEEHIVVIRGYDEKGAYILDSHHKQYKGRLKEFRNGDYRVSWNDLAAVGSWGDIIIPQNYRLEL